MDRDEPSEGSIVSPSAPMMDRRTALKRGGVLGLAAVPLGIVPMTPTLAAMAAPLKPAPGGPSLTSVLSTYAAGTTFEKLPEIVRERARKVIFDEMACAYFGRRSPGGELADRYVTRMASQEQARIYGTDHRASGPYAAMANGTAGHGDEVDGTHVIGGHPGASIVHASTAIAEQQDASGAELLNAVVLGYDVGVRMVEACGGKFRMRDTEHLTSDFLYSLGCTTAAARVLRLDPERTGHSLALVTFQTNGLYALYAERRHISKSFCNGQYAFAGISAAMMAEVGLEGNDDIIGADEGLLDAWGDGQHNQSIIQGLGTEFKIMGANFKFYNAGYPIHTPIEAALTLARKNNIASDAITSILIGMPQNAMKVVNDRAMHNISVRDMVSANLTTGGLKLADMPFPKILDDRTYQRLRGLIRVEVDPELQREFPDGRGARVTITTKAGAAHTLRIDNPRGHSLRGEVSWDDLLEKWRGSLPGCDVEKALGLARKLDQLPKATILFDAFAGINR